MKQSSASCPELVAVTDPWPSMRDARARKDRLGFQVAKFVLVFLSHPRPTSDMAPAKKDRYSVILPTYNERQNLPVLVQMLYDVFSQEYEKTAMHGANALTCTQETRLGYHSG